MAMIIEGINPNRHKMRIISHGMAAFRPGILIRQRAARHQWSVSGALALLEVLGLFF